MTFAPLDSVRVLDLTRLLPGPYGTQLLAEMGAEVVKVEEPSTGDYLRDADTDGGDGPHGMTYYFEYLNAGKRSVALDLKTDAGREAFYELAAAADVVAESFRPGVVDRLGVDYETLHRYNEDIVYCSLSGYGQGGPYRDRSGHDINYLAVSGILGLTGEPDGPPVVPGTTVADLAAGTFLALSVVGALVGDGGRYIDLSMTDVVSTWTLPYMHQYFSTGISPDRGGTRHQRYPAYNVYPTADDRYVALGCLEKKFWANLCRVIDREEYIDDHLSTDPATRTAIREDLTAVFESRPRDDWVADLTEHDVPIAPVNDLDEIPDDPQIAAREVIVGTDLERFRFPAVFDDPLVGAGPHPPARGEDTEAVLREHGFDDDEIEALVESGPNR